MIINYTICITRWKNGTCSGNFTTKSQIFIVNDLKPATTYYISVLASTIIGPGNYSENEIAITNECKFFIKTFFFCIFHLNLSLMATPIDVRTCYNLVQPEKPTNFTEKTLTFSLKIPVQEYE